MPTVLTKSTDGVLAKVVKMIDSPVAKGKTSEPNNCRQSQTKVVDDAHNVDRNNMF
jgi:hypothetical protein